MSKTNIHIDNVYVINKEVIKNNIHNEYYLNKPRIQVTYQCLGISVTGEHVMSKLPDNLNAKLTIEAKDKFGLPATLDGVVSFSSSDESIVIVESTGPNTAIVKPAVQPKLGTAQINFSADADTGDGVQLIEGFVEVTVTASQAVSFGASFELVEPIPADPTPAEPEAPVEESTPVDQTTDESETPVEVPVVEETAPTEEAPAETTSEEPVV